MLILGFYFGSEKLLQRYSFLQNEINDYLPSSTEVIYLEVTLAKFAFIEFKKFILFGYGGGGFEYLFKINFQNLQQILHHIHSDLIEFIGEFGHYWLYFDFFKSFILMC